VDHPSAKTGSIMMNEWVRFLVWSSLLGPAGWMASGPYQQWLSAVVRALSAAMGHRIRINELEVYAPVEIGIFLAMCLATSGVRVASRMRAAVLGVPILILLEIAILLLASLPVMVGGAGSNGEGPLGDLVHYFLKSIVWVDAGLVWAVLLAGRFETAPARRRI
jgi:hypothetical protein